MLVIKVYIYFTFGSRIFVIHHKKLLIISDTNILWECLIIYYLIMQICVISLDIFTWYNFKFYFSFPSCSVNTVYFLNLSSYLRSSFSCVTPVEHMYELCLLSDSNGRYVWMYLLSLHFHSDAQSLKVS